MGCAEVLVEAWKQHYDRNDARCRCGDLCGDNVGRWGRVSGGLLTSNSVRHYDGSMYVFDGGEQQVV